MVITKLFIHFPPRHELATLKLKDKLKYLDVIGILTLSATMVCLLFALELGGNTYSWANARVIVLFVLAGVFLIAFLAYQVWKKDQALVPVRILRQRSIGFAFLYVLASSASTILSEYYVSYALPFPPGGVSPTVTLADPWPHRNEAAHLLPNQQVRIAARLWPDASSHNHQLRRDLAGIRRSR